MMRKSFKHSVMLLAAAISLPGAAQAHRQWMLPSSTVLSGDDAWVTVDAAVSNDLFYFDHQPMRTDAVKAIAPDGTEVKIENASTGRYRSTFDVHLLQKGTYKIVSATNFVMGSYILDGKEVRLPRGTTTETLAAAIPAGATDVKTSEIANRNEIFVTVGAPTDTVFRTTGKGLEMLPVTHPNDLVAKEPATFQFLLDGKPAADLPVTVVEGGVRYRGTPGQIDLKTDKNGKVTVTWPEAGMYWLNASVGGRPEGGPTPGAAGGAPKPGADTPPKRPENAGPPPRRAGYVTTLEVLAP